MWMICAAMSLILMAINWIFARRKSKMRYWAAAGSLAFVSITLLLEYGMVQQWVSREDWSALLDVVPSAFPVLIGYVVLLILGNAAPLVFKGKG